MAERVGFEPQEPVGHVADETPPAAIRVAQNSTSVNRPESEVVPDAVDL